MTVLLATLAPHAAGATTGTASDPCEPLGKAGVLVEDDAFDVTADTATATFSIADDACETMVNLDLFDVTVGTERFREWDAQVLVDTVQASFGPGGPYELEIAFDRDLCAHQIDLYVGASDGIAPHRHEDLVDWEVGGSATPCADDGPVDGDRVAGGDGSTADGDEPDEGDGSTTGVDEESTGDGAPETGTDEEPTDDGAPERPIPTEPTGDRAPETGDDAVDPTPDDVVTVPVGEDEIPVPTVVDTGAGGAAVGDVAASDGAAGDLATGTAWTMAALALAGLTLVGGWRRSRRARVGRRGR